MITVIHIRDYEYVCPECKKHLAPIDKDGHELIFRKCSRVKRHASGQSVAMKLVKLPRIKIFHFQHHAY
jgi:hypothetical protein